ncbi:rhs repeat-associated core domain-containing protein : YD repeat protein OS=Isosphaera pallida (strain ATCC 43644 / DSM 9630 / IS1B) GN=Isop_2419 PE=4 SV=1: VCBS: RHS_repeat [Gemmata massiliana]|uniref:Insecticide toxin TcdB middle/N-terminal domain-containing protein n=1 Tax=Gemmata massiliana TaxID=1210884 RepID=A0A6P2CYC9_9BACT|nr:RHS repeat-associated core domain-containing protein [Gemmata massiliana]VTR93557.1 rhs repeat-associated core domain-containing protein : YD repeat protein OS=Isosphaera pallida (strain ATCC 43644 / DSM 9630 / IS1B) GN=Isop_2419 PE=4 SV=1: VCBS: RHS_repeat [Gemmata massiliana]
MSLSSPARIPSRFTMFARLVALRERIAGLFRAAPRTSARPVRLGVEAMEERLVPDGRPLPYPVIFAGSGVGEAAVVKAYDADTGNLRWTKSVYGPLFTGGVRVATADFTGDGIPDAVVAPGSGYVPLVRVLDGTTGNEISGPLGHFLAYSSLNTGGVHVAAADVNGDGKADAITTADSLLGTRARAFSGANGQMLLNWNLTGAPFAAGATVGAVDLNGDHKAEVILGGSSGGWVKAYDPTTGAPISGPLGSFQAFGTGYTGSVFVNSDSLTNDVDGDGTPDLVVGTGAGATAQVKVFSGATGGVLYDFQPFGSGFTGGARVALAYADDDDRADIVVGSGPGAADVRVFSGATGLQLTSPLGQYAPFGSSTGGVFVAASNDPASPLRTDYFNGSTSAPSLVGGQTLSVYSTMYQVSFVPTGTMTYTLYDGASNLLGTWVQGLTVLSSTTSTTSPFNVALPAGSFTLKAAYSGDAHWPPDAGPSTILSATVSAPSGPAPVAPSVPGPGLIEAPVGAGIGIVGDAPTGVDYGTGTITVDSCPDLSSVALGDLFGLSRSWTSAAGYEDGLTGTGGSSGQFAHAVQVNGNDSVALALGGSDALFFDYYGGAYHGRFGDPTALVHDTTNGLFVATDGTGRVLTFYDFSASTPSGRAGRLKTVADADGQATAVTSWDGNGRPSEVQRTTGSGGGALTESFVYAYVGSGTNAGLLQSVTQRTKVGAGSWSTVRSADYAYYDGTTGPGLAKALKSAVVKDASGTALSTSYYRYYTSGTGSSGKLKYAFSNGSYDRLASALGTGLDALTDAQVDDYADKYVEYNASGQATKVVDAAAGCSVCAGGQGQFTYAYATNSAAGLLDANVWKNKAVETLPDGSTNTVYTNGFGQAMLRVFTDTASNVWRWYTKYDSAGRVILEAGPSVVTGFSESYADLVNFVSGNAQYLSDSAGLVTAYTYGSTTTATTPTAGDALGYLKEVDLKQGETGTAVPQQVLAYIKNTVSSVDFFNLASSTVYRNDNGTGAQTTSYAYTYLSGTNQIASTVTTLPTVTAAQNGSNSATTVTTVNDAFGHPVWTKDQAGIISYAQYDTLTGAVVKTITDVDTTQAGTFANLPSGWSTPSGAGLHLTTTYEVDALGRATKVTYPNGRVDYTVYNDANQEVRSYAGWDSTNNVPTGATTVSRMDRAGGYAETLTMSAAPTVSGGRPTGAESVAKVQSLSRAYTNAAGQTIYSDAYFNLSGLTYSTSTALGTEGVNFYRTRYQYDDQGRLNKTTSPQGTISRTVYDSLGRAVSAWIGTDDTPTSGYWSPTNLTGTNTVKVAEYEYDGGGVGEGNLTKVTEIPGGGAANRVTQTWFDWRNRTVAVKSGAEGSESTSVNRPLTYYDYDNLGEVTKARVYDADAVTPTVTGGVPQPLSSGLLRAQTTTNYDELGRAYRADVYSVDISTGSVATNTLYAQTWYDARGQVSKTWAPGGTVQKTTYDGAGRAVATYTSDGGGDTGYSDADDVTGDTVLNQTEYVYDGNGSVLQVTTRERFHDASGTGALGTPTTGIGARVSYTGYYYDLAGRTVAAVDVGTNGGSSWSRPGTVPSRSATVLVSSTKYATDAVQVIVLTGSPTGGTFALSFGGSTTSALAYNASAATVQAALAGLASIGSGNVQVSAAAGGGWEVRFIGTKAGTYQAAITSNGAGLTGGTSPAASTSTINAGGDAGHAAEVTDSAGHVSRTYADALGRTTRSVTNFVDGVVSDADDKSTGYAYNGAGMTSLIAYLTGGGVQTTGYVYGVTAATGSTIESNDIARLTQWADPTTGAASSSQQEAVAVNALGQTLTSTDRNGSVHTLTYDVLGRVVSDAVTTLGSGVDGAVRRVETAYDGQGNAYLVTNYSAASGGSIVNQVQRAYNGLGQMTTEWQSHTGAVNTSTSPKVQYAYSEMAGGANHSRPASVTYPSGYVLTYNYSSGLNDSNSRLSSLSDSTGTLESYDYLGLDTVVRRAHPQPNVDLSYIKRAGESNGDAGDQYTGLDRFGRVVDQRWLNPSTGTATDRFQYGYDQAGNRTYRDNLVNTAFGEVYSYDALDQLTGYSRGTLNGTKTGITGTVARSQGWDYDALGNFDSVTTNGTAQTRTANKQNEITGISGATTPTYDANGDMTGDEAGQQLVYDAWNRLVAVKNSGGTVLKTYTYDGLNRRTTETASGTTTDLFYSKDWQVLEEKVGSATKTRYVWSPVYVDAMVLRDRDADGNTGNGLEERLWAQQDANWNVTALVNGSGAVVERYAYDPYGARTVYDASYAVRGGGSAYNFAQGFQGMTFDATTGMGNQRARWYSPTISRWGTTDPIQFGSGDTNLYRFASGNPLNRIDPSGLTSLFIGIRPTDPSGVKIDIPRNSLLGLSLIARQILPELYRSVAEYAREIKEILQSLPELRAKRDRGYEELEKYLKDNPCASPADIGKAARKAKDSATPYEQARKRYNQLVEKAQEYIAMISLAERQATLGGGVPVANDVDALRPTYHLMDWLEHLQPIGEPGQMKGD